MFENLINDANTLAEKYIADCTEVKAEQLGLDKRAAYGFLFVCEDFIAVERSQDRSLQYYGGFEYVDEEYRMQMGDWVFYSAEDDRVQGHISTALDGDQDEEDC